MPTAPDLITQLGYDYSEYRSVILEDIPLDTLYSLLSTKVDIAGVDTTLVRQLMRQDVNRMQMLSLIASAAGGATAPGDVAARAAVEQLFVTLGYDLNFYRAVMRTGFTEYDLVALIVTKLGVDDVDPAANALFVSRDMGRFELLATLVVKLGNIAPVLLGSMDITDGDNMLAFTRGAPGGYTGATGAAFAYEAAIDEPRTQHHVAGDVGFLFEETPTPCALPAPTNLSFGANGINLNVSGSWDAVTGSVAKYQYRYDGAGGPFDVTPDDTATSLTTTGAAGTHTVQIRAVSPSGVAGAWSAASGNIVLVGGGGGGSGTPNLVAHTVGGSTDGTAFGTPSIDTSGANLLVVVCAEYGQPVLPSVVFDSKGNTWTQLTLYTAGSTSVRTSIWYSVPISVGSGHSFDVSVPGSNTYAAIAVQAFSDANASPLDVENGNHATNTTLLQPGSITPSGNGRLIVAGIGFGSTDTMSISGYTITDQTPLVGSAHFAVAMAYKIQATAGAENPTWTWTTSDSAAAAIAAFKP